VLCKGGYDVAGAIAEAAPPSHHLISRKLCRQRPHHRRAAAGELNFKNMYSAGIHAGSTKTQAGAGLSGFPHRPWHPAALDRGGHEPAF